MKHLRLFPNAQVRDSVLADINYPVLHSTDGVGISVKPGVHGPDYSEPFYVENITQENEALIISVSSDYGSDYIVEYSIDKINWELLGKFDEIELYKELHPNDKIYLRTNSPYLGRSGTGIRGISKIGGNIMSLMYGSNFTGNERTFPQVEYPGGNLSAIFSNNTRLIDASLLILPVTTLEESCYSRMFGGCTSLTTAPAILPATTLANDCYYSMFRGCTSLTTAPALPATTLAEYCYQGMFMNCTSLTTAPALPATTLANYCYESMFNGCTSLTNAPSVLPASIMVYGCYETMFEGCTALTTAPELPATTLVDYCYQRMFNGCTNLNYIKCLATDISADVCTQSWLEGVAPTGTFVKAASMSSWTTGTAGIPSGWTVQDAA